MAELGQPVQVPRGFAFSFNLGGDRPQQQQQQVRGVSIEVTVAQNCWALGSLPDFVFWGG